MEKGYLGRINNRGNQVVKAPVKTPKSKSGKVKTGSDLRAK